MAQDIRIEIVGQGDADAKLAAINALLNGPNRRQLLFSFGGVLQSEAARTFRDQADPITGAPWKPTGQLALSTRVGGGSGGKALLDKAGSGGLLGSLVSGAPDITGESVRIGSNLPYAKIQNEGGTVEPVNAKFLAIPITRKAHLAGSPRRFKETPRDRLRDNYVFVKKVTIPARPYIGISQRCADRLVALTVNFINSAMGSIVVKRA